MEEVRYFGRLALYALVVGIAYWFLSYEPAGTVLLIGFGLATGGAFVVLRSGARSGPGPADAAEEAGSTRADGPFGDESGPVPTRSGAPLAVGFGIAAVALAGAFGPWFIIAGAVPLLLGATDWLRAANRELALRSSTDEPATSVPAHGGRATDGAADRAVDRAADRATGGAAQRLDAAGTEPPEAGLG